MTETAPSWLEFVMDYLSDEDIVHCCEADFSWRLAVMDTLTKRALNSEPVELKRCDSAMEEFFRENNVCIGFTQNKPIYIRPNQFFCAPYDWRKQPKNPKKVNLHPRLTKNKESLPNTSQGLKGVNVDDVQGSSA